MKKTVFLRTADGIMSEPVRIEKDMFVIERPLRNNKPFNWDKPIESFQPMRVRKYRFEGEFTRASQVDPKFGFRFEIFDEVV